MPKANDPVETLARLLEGSKANPVMVPSRLAPSAIYDVEYRTVVIALLFEKFAKSFEISGHRRISTAKLKLLQFVTFRPWLIHAIREWSKGEEQGSLGLTQSMRSRRGFLSDTAHEDVINLLVACGVFVRVKSHLVSGEKVGELAKIRRAMEEQDLFGSLQHVISELAEIPLTKSMLEGW
jgi:hypothetical protein